MRAANLSQAAYVLKTEVHHYRYIMTAQDAFSKFAFAICLKDQTADTIAKAFTENISLAFGTCEHLVTDQGRNYIHQ